MGGRPIRDEGDAHSVPVDACVRPADVQPLACERLVRVERERRRVDAVIE